jgi:ferredoxin-NADP reductase
LGRLTPVPQRAPGRWQVGTVASVKRETPRVKSFRVELPMWMPHLPGQHYDVRLTAPDGYQAQRSYSVASSPVVLIGGGSGVVPLMAMLRHRRLTMPEVPMRLIYSVRAAEDVIYADELGGDALLTFTRKPPDGWAGHTGRIDAALIAEAAPAESTTFICGSNAFVETAGRLVLEAGADPERILTERVGPTG